MSKFDSIIKASVLRTEEKFIAAAIENELRRQGFEFEKAQGHAQWLASCLRDELRVVVDEMILAHAIDETSNLIDEDAVYQD